MTRRKLFREADLARALRVTVAAGVDVGRVRIDADGAIVIESRPSPQGDEDGPAAVDAALEAVRRRSAQRRAARTAQGQGQTGGR